MATAPVAEDDMVATPGGGFRVGSDRFYAEEAPVREVETGAFRIDRYPVTSRRFAAFVKATGHVTLAGRGRAGAPVFRPARVPVPLDDCAWGGARDADHAWGGGPPAPDGRRMANIWQGPFPIPADRRARWWSSAVKPFDANGFGLHDMIGNVWEWTSDWYGVAAGAGCCVGSPPPSAVDPVGGVAHRVVEGGSFLCSPDYCARYRPAARQPQAIDTAACHLGFRCVAD